MHLPNDQKKLNPVGEWNTSKIVFNKGHVEHWLNGKKILEFTAWDADWSKKKAGSRRGTGELDKSASVRPSACSRAPAVATGAEQVWVQVHSGVVARR